MFLFISFLPVGPDDKWKLSHVMEVSGRFPYGKYDLLVMLNKTRFM